VFGKVKVLVLLSFTMAAYNLDRVRSFKAKQAARRSTEEAGEAPAWGLDARRPGRARAAQRRHRGPTGL